MENIEKLIDKEKIMKQLEEEGKEFRKRRIELSESNYEVLVDEIKIHIRDKFTNEIKEEYDTIVRLMADYAHKELLKNKDRFIGVLRKLDELQEKNDKEFSEKRKEIEEKIYR